MQDAAKEVSSTGDPDKAKVKVKREMASSSSPSQLHGGPGSAGSDKMDAAGDEPGDFIETNCHWRDCNLEYGTQDELVKVRELAKFEEICATLKKVVAHAFRATAHAQWSILFYCYHKKTKMRALASLRVFMGVSISAHQQ